MRVKIKRATLVRKINDVNGANTGACYCHCCKAQNIRNSIMPNMNSLPINFNMPLPNSILNTKRW